MQVCYDDLMARIYRDASTEILELLSEDTIALGVEDDDED